LAGNEKFQKFQKSKALTLGKKFLAPKTILGLPYMIFKNPIEIPSLFIIQNQDPLEFLRLHVWKCWDFLGFLGFLGFFGIIPEC
jgi:hypothetical protein